MATDWQRVTEVFEAAAERAPAERGAYLDAACAADQNLRREVESLLAHDAAANGTFLETAPPPTFFAEAVRNDSVVDDRRIGETVAGYRLIEHLASGGMGAVYRARQEKLRRDVALKIVRPGLSTTGALRRLEHEAQYLARLRHPHIAQIFETGTFADAATGATLPYFVMELVESARPITAYCATGPLELRDRLALFLQVCDAVHHGHQRGLIHRDLKPGNILVDAAGQVKIIDFGVARSTDADITLTTLRSDSTHLFGTLQYMSPEQCSADAADLDVRSDVYALGVVLYELVCDKHPYDLADATIYTAARIVCDQPAEPPRVANPRLPRDLEAILLKCLEKDRTRRYQSAAQLADDVRRHLLGESVTARAPGRYRRLIRWVSRHAVATTALACALLLAVTAVTTAVGVQIMARRPNKLYISKDRSEVQLETMAGLRRGAILRGPAECVCGWPQLVPHKNRHLAIIGLPTAENGSVGPGLYAFDADKGLNSDGVVWRCTITTADFPPPPRGREYTPENFVLAKLELIDVFAETPGPELISTWSHEMYSWRALRIHDLDGNLLYQLWHDGSIGSVQWLREARLLVVAGGYCTHDPWRVVPELKTLDRVAFDLPVLFAIRPRFGQIETSLISVPEREEWRDLSQGRDTAVGPRATPQWYKFVWPLHRRYVLRIEDWDPQNLLRVADLADGTHAQAAIKFIDRDQAELGGLHWTIDQQGDAVATSFVEDDPYRRSRDAGHALPPAPNYRIVDLEALRADPFGEIAYGTAMDAAASPSPSQ